MKALFAFCFIFIATATGLAWAGYIEWRNSRKLVAEGRSTVGHVTDTQSISGGRRGRDTYYLVVAFETEKGAARTSTIKVSWDVYYSAAIGGTVQLHYLPSDPDVVQVGGKPRVRRRAMVEGIVYMAFGIGVTALCVGCWVFYGGRAPIPIRLSRSTWIGEPSQIGRVFVRKQKKDGPE
ncbi:MAG TPA: DUF3592 domain-containing protein [Verrucomicrobiae bacterium]|nr:DUF3592 domain-containing protein [Verrucomicrobiae bacterium]